MSETATLATKQNPLQYVTDQLNELREKGVAPKLRVLEGEQRPVCVFDGREVINLASNNYLGLTTHKALRKAALDAVKRYGAGAGAVRTIAGTMKLHLELEEQIAAFKKVEACVVFQSGFTANAGTVSAVLGKEDLIVSDELNHASIIDGARLSKATGTRSSFSCSPTSGARCAGRRDSTVAASSKRSTSTPRACSASSASTRRGPGWACSTRASPRSSSGWPRRAPTADA